MEKITEYLNHYGNSTEDIILLDDDKIRADESECLLKVLRKQFNEEALGCKEFYNAVSGEGKEDDKISTAYSSALQAFLIFGKVSQEQPIVINGIRYTKACFEYKNKVIGYPSSVDVVLVSENGKKQLFIESKLYEPIRDSSKDGKKEVGPSYYSDNENGYSKLNLSCKELKSIGMDLYDDKIDAAVLYKLGANKLKSSVAKSKNDKAYDKINKIESNKYVYSYGIKQILAHAIGILNMENPDKDCSDELKNTNPENRELVYVYNALPGYDEKDLIKLDNFIKHYEKTRVIINNKGLGITIGEALTYQKIYEQNKDYFSNKIVKYYKLDK